MIDSNVLQSVPGTKGIKFYPYIRKIDLMSSNSYLLSGAEQIAIIDPGAIDDQLDRLFEIIAAMVEEKPRPIVVYLTHAHLDHCYQLKRLKDFRNLGDILVAAQERGAEALETQDSKMTLAGLLGKELAGISVDVRLLSNRDTLAEREFHLQFNDTELAYLTKSIKIPHGPVLNSQIVALSKDDPLEIYHIPGHSPDSICFRVGRLIFLGDLFFAPNPGVAGAFGWSQSDLLSSIQKVLWILERKNILLCCSGHGRTVDVDTAWTTLRSMYQDVLSLSSLEEITPEWARNTAAYAEYLIRELERLFTIIIGRIVYISHVLDELEEINEADNLQSLINADQIDELFWNFNQFARELHAGKKLEWELVHKAGQIVGKLGAIYENRMLSSFLDQYLLKRVNRILDDYTVTYRGFSPTYYVTDVDINAAIGEVLEYAEYKVYEDEAILDANSHEDYIWALRTRIAHVNPFKNTSLAFEEDQSLPSVRMDKERFTEALVDVLERLASAGAKEIRITPSINEGWVVVRLCATESIYVHPLNDEVMRFFERAFSLSGGFIQSHTAETGPIVDIEFLPSTIF
jgi:glyoxylase-like metal-dependent hydrolase (beta-lactamase superfamily II)